MNLPEEQTLNTPPADSSPVGQSESQSQPNSTTVEQGAEATPKTDVKPSTATPSVADDPKPDAKPTSLLDALKKVVTDKPEHADSSPEGQKDKASDDAAKPNPADEEKNKAKSEEDARLDKHPRFIELNTRMKAAERDANEYRVVDNFIKSNGLSYDEVGEGFEIMALMKSNPLQAREKLMKYVDALDQFAGVKLPADLQERVKHGLVDLETAQELARTRNQQMFESNRAAQEARARHTQQAQQTTQQVQSEIQGIIQNWENGVAARDVDFAKKQPLIHDRIIALRATMPVRNAQEVLAIVQRAYDDVNKNVSVMIPTRKPMNPVNSGMSSSSNLAAPAPKSVREAITQAIRP